MNNMVVLEVEYFELDIVEPYQCFGMNNMVALEVEYFVLNYMLNLMLKNLCLEHKVDFVEALLGSDFH